MGKGREKQETARREAIFDIPPYLITAGVSQPRTEPEDTALVRLADSIRRYGVLHPLTVRLNEKGRYELIAGERRLRAAKLLQLPVVPCVLVKSTPRRAACLAIVENLQRERLGPFDEARALERLMAEEGCSAEECADRLSIPRGEVRELLLLNVYSPSEKQLARSAGLSVKQAVALSFVPASCRAAVLLLAAKESLSDAECAAFAEKLSKLPSPTPKDAEALIRNVKKKAAPDGERKPKDAPTGGKIIKLGLRDLGTFHNALDRSCAILRLTGMEVTKDVKEAPDGEVITIKVKSKREE